MRRLAVALIRWYQRAISPGRPPSCRYLPTCSDYGAQAVAHYGLLRGGAKTAWRILRCNPVSPGGYDPPVPAPRAGAAHRWIQATCIQPAREPRGAALAPATMRPFHVKRVHRPQGPPQ